jgi:hypothetical protein
MRCNGEAPGEGPASARGPASIGTLGEKTLHAALKRHCEPAEAFHEAHVGRFVADILTDSGIIEIQTQAFNRLRGKLDAFLADRVVTLVYPIVRLKRILWVDAATGEVLRSRRSPKRGSFYCAFAELYKIKRQLLHPNLRLRLILLDAAERRCESGNRKGYSKIDTVPLGGSARNGGNGDGGGATGGDGCGGTRNGNGDGDSSTRSGDSDGGSIRNGGDGGWGGARNGGRNDGNGDGARSGGGFDIIDELAIESAQDYAELLPAGLPESFTSRDYGRAASLDMRRAQLAVNVLCHVGVISRVGKSGRLLLYERPKRAGGASRN